MLRQSRSTRSLEERLPASKAYDVLGSFVRFQLRRCGAFGVFGFALTLRRGFSSVTHGGCCRNVLSSVVFFLVFVVEGELKVEFFFFCSFCPLFFDSFFLIILSGKTKTP